MSTLELTRVNVGDELPTRHSHRIHYDERYTTEVEHHPGVVIDGPLQGDWLSQVAANWVGENGRVVQFTYANRRAAYLGETVISGGSVKAVNADAKTIELELFIKNAGGDVITPGSATVAID